MENKLDTIEFIIFIIGLIISLFSIPVALVNKGPCSEGEGFFGVLLSFVCNYGLKGIIFYLILIITLVLFLHLIVKFVNNRKK